MRRKAAAVGVTLVCGAVAAILGMTLSDERTEPAPPVPVPALVTPAAVLPLPASGSGPATHRTGESPIPGRGTSLETPVARYL